MYATARPFSPTQCSTKGVALIGASVVTAASIGLMPHTAQLPDPVKVSTAAIQLVAQVDPLQTLMDALNTVGGNLQTIANNWQRRPAPLLQQIIANQLSYGTTVVKGLTFEVTNIGKYAGQLVDPAFLQQMATNLSQGNVQAVYNAVAKILIPAGYILVPALTNIANIPAYVLTNLAATVKVLAGSGLSALGTAAFTVMLGMSGAVATGVQGAIDAGNAGDPLGVLSNLANIPGLMVGNVLTGANGLLSPTGLLGQVVVRLPQLIASTIVAPGAQNIFKGGTLDAAFGTLTDSFGKLLGAFGLPVPAAATVSTTAAINALAAPAALGAATPAGPASVPSVKPAAIQVTLTGTATDAAKASAKTAAPIANPAASADVQTKPATDPTAPIQPVKEPAAKQDSPSVTTLPVTKPTVGTTSSTKVADNVKIGGGTTTSADSSVAGTKGGSATGGTPDSKTVSSGTKTGAPSTAGGSSASPGATSKQAKGASAKAPSNKPQHTSAGAAHTSK